MCSQTDSTDISCNRLFAWSVPLYSIMCASDRSYRESLSVNISIMYQEIPAGIHLLVSVNLQLFSV